MAEGHDERRTDQARKWVEETLGGTIVSWRKDERWRPQYFADVRRKDGSEISVLLRGWRVPGVVDTADNSRLRLEREAAVVKALEGLPVKSPRYYGYEPEGGWILMEAVPGDDLLTDVADVQRQTRLFCDYISDFATIHAADPASLGLPGSFAIPESPEANARANYNAHRATYRERGCGPDPLMELGWCWLDAHSPAPPQRWSLCTGDMGANQFMFGPEGYRSLFDVEMAYIGDPLQDIGMMRYRNSVYPVADFEAVLRHYFEAARREFDVASLQYWTMVGLMGAMPTFWSMEAKPNPDAPGDMLLVWAMTNRRRAMVQCLQQIYGFDTPPVAGLPASDAGTDPAVRHLDYLVHALDGLQASEGESMILNIARANAAIALRKSVHGAAFEAADLADLESLTGERHGSLLEARNRLIELIRCDYEKDLERRLLALGRIEWRKEYIYQPAQKAVGFASFHPLDATCRIKP